MIYWRNQVLGFQSGYFESVAKWIRLNFKRFFSNSDGNVKIYLLYEGIQINLKTSTKLPKFLFTDEIISITQKTKNKIKNYRIYLLIGSQKLSTA